MINVEFILTLYFETKENKISIHNYLKDEIMGKQSLRNTFILFLLTTVSAVALEIGIDFKTGLNISHSREELKEGVLGDFDSTKSLLSLTGGIAVPLHINKVFTIQPEIGISSTGWRYHNSDTSTYYDSLNNLQESSYDMNHYKKATFLDIPLLFKINIPTSTRLTPNIYLGPSISFILTASYREKGVSNGVTIDSTYTDLNTYSEGELLKSQERKDLYNNPTLSFILGTGFTFNLNTGHIIMDLRYTRGLSNIEENNLWTSKINAFAVMIGYGFDF